MTQTQKALATKDQHLPVPKELTNTAWGSEGVDTSDVKIPAILLMQGLSQFVIDRKATIGDLVHSQTEKVIGGPDTPVHFIPIMTFKTNEYMEKEPGSEKFKRKKSEPWEAHHKTIEPYGTTIDGVHFRNDPTLNFYVFLQNEIEKEGALPCLLKCKRTNLTAGKNLVTHFKQCEMKKIPPASTIYALTSTTQKNDLGTFSVLVVTPAGDTKPAHLPKLYEWYKLITSGDTKVVSGTEEDEEKVPF